MRVTDDAAGHQLVLVMAENAGQGTIRGGLVREPAGQFGDDQAYRLRRAPTARSPRWSRVTGCQRAWRSRAAAS